MSQYGHVRRAAVSHSAALLYSAELQPGVKYEICAECLAAAVLQCYDVAMQPDNSLDCRMGCWLFTAQKIFALTFLV